MNIEIVDRPTFLMDTMKVARPGESKDWYTTWESRVEVKPSVVIKDLETTLGLKECDPTGRNVVLRVILRKIDGEVRRLAFRSGSYRRSDWGDGKSTAARVAEDLLEALGYRFRVYRPYKGDYVFFDSSLG